MCAFGIVSTFEEQQVAYLSRRTKLLRCTQALLVIVMLIFGFMGMAAYGIALELSAEITYPTIESTPAGCRTTRGECYMYSVQDSFN